jgi:hypothetical protein
MDDHHLNYITKLGGSRKNIGVSYIDYGDKMKKSN